MNKQGCVYILASKVRGTLYIGVTSSLLQRIWRHKQEQVEGFTQKYGVKELVYYEVVDEIVSAITRGKQIKQWNRAWKIRLIEEMNP